MNKHDSLPRLLGPALAAGLALVAASCGVGNVTPGSTAAPAAPTAAAAPAAAVAAPTTTTAATPVGAGTVGTQPNCSATFTAPPTGAAAAASFAPASALWGIGRTPAGQPMLAVKLGSDADECARMTAGTVAADSHILWLRVVGPNFNNFTATVPPSPSGSAASATFYALDATCQDSLAGPGASAGLWASGGTIAVQLHANNQVTGSFSLDLGTGGQPTAGTFLAVACPAVGQLITTPSQVRTCQ